MIIENGQKVKAGEVIVKIPRAVGKAGDITDHLMLRNKFGLYRS